MIEEIEQNVIRWAEHRGIYRESTTKDQTLKLVEEVGELCKAVLEDNNAEVIDGLGDALVVITNIAHMRGLTLWDCYAAAYREIKDRKGKMRDGTFIKDL